MFATNYRSGLFAFSLKVAAVAASITTRLTVFPDEKVLFCLKAPVKLINNFWSILQLVLRINIAQKTIPAAQLIKLYTATLVFHVAHPLNVSQKLI